MCAFVSLLCFQAQFGALGLSPELMSAVSDMGWSLPTAVQDESIPLILGGADVMIAAETGSGKTGAFALPLMQIVHETMRGEADVAAVSHSAESNADPNAPMTITMSRTDRDSQCAVDSTGTLVQSRHPRDWAGVRSTSAPYRGGAYAFECTVTDEGLCRIGFTTRTGTRQLGTDNNSFGFGGTGKKSHANTFTDYGITFGLNDIIYCIIDYNHYNISFQINNKHLGVAFDIPEILHGIPLYPAVTLKNAEVRVNFGETPFKHTLPDACQTMNQTLFKDSSLSLPIPTTITTANSSSSSSSSSSSASSSSSSSAPNTSRKSSSISKGPFAIILEPTRELAQQVHEELSKFSKYLHNPDIIVESIVGGMDNRMLDRILSRGPIHVLSGTPSRIADLIKNKKIDISTNLRYFVLDEADQLIETGFSADMLIIYEQMPKNKNTQIIICSATLHSPEITVLANKITHQPQWVDLKGKDSVPDTVDHCVIIVDPRTDTSWQHNNNNNNNNNNSGVSSSSTNNNINNIPVHTDGIHPATIIKKNNNKSFDNDMLSEGIKRLKPRILLSIINQFQMDQCLIFCRTQLDCDLLEEYLLIAGGGIKLRIGSTTGVENIYSTAVLHGGRTAEERIQHLAAFKAGQVRFLICTDVAARGIDITGLPYVINMTLPDKPETYIHRIGRVGRADHIGLAISLVAAEDLIEKQWFHTCNRTDRGRNCHNINLVNNGGCVIEFNEYNMLKSIEERLHQSIARLNADTVVSGAEAIIAVASKNRGVKRYTDGRVSEAELRAVSEARVAILAPAVRSLAEMEFAAERRYWTLKQNTDWTQLLKKARANK